MQHPRINKKHTVLNKKSGNKIPFNVQHNTTFRHIPIKIEQKKNLNEDPRVLLRTFQMQLAKHLYIQDMY
jgi:hypothetical protein